MDIIRVDDGWWMVEDYMISLEPPAPGPDSQLCRWMVEGEWWRVILVSF